VRAVWLYGANNPWLRGGSRLAKWNLRSGCGCERLIRYGQAEERDWQIAAQYPLAEVDAAVVDYLDAASLCPDDA
jgi:hypothetical protein